MLYDTKHSQNEVHILHVYDFNNFMPSTMAGLVNVRVKVKRIPDLLLRDIINTKIQYFLVI